MDKSANKFTSIVDEEYIEKMTPREFELTVRDYITELGKGLADFKVTHDTHLAGSDGIYQIDVIASYTALGVKMLVLVECKRYAHSVGRDHVQLLNDKLRSTGAHKGILFSTAGFQAGAIEYALRHKIALIRMLTSRFEHITNSLAKPKRGAPTPPVPKTFIGECYCDNKMFYIKTQKLDGLVNYLTSGA